MKNRFVLIGLVFSLVTTMLITSCSKEPDRQTWPFSAEIYYSSDTTQVAFTALTHSATSWLWDFGNENTSTEKNPVYTYPEGGYYAVTLTASDNNGNEIVKQVNIAIALTPYSLLVGDHTAPDYNGKAWKLNPGHSSSDIFANADADFSVMDGTPAPLPANVFSMYLGMPEVYEDEYTFHYDGSYGHDVKDDGAAFSGLVYQLISSGGANIVNMGGQDFGLCTGKYTPEDGATFTFEESEDLDVLSVYGPGGVLTYEGVMTLDFSGTEFIGFMDFQRKVIVLDITNSSMRVALFMSASPDYQPLNTHALILTFEVVD